MVIVLVVAAALLSYGYARDDRSKRCDGKSVLATASGCSKRIVKTLRSLSSQNQREVFGSLRSGVLNECCSSLLRFSLPCLCSQELQKGCVNLSLGLFKIKKERKNAKVFSKATKDQEGYEQDRGEGTSKNGDFEEYETLLQGVRFEFKNESGGSQILSRKSTKCRLSRSTLATVFSREANALELRAFLDGHGLFEYADALEATRKTLAELRRGSSSVLSTRYGMKKGHASRFMEQESPLGDPKFTAGGCYLFNFTWLVIWELATYLRTNA
ncbi:hypothetical protein SELMODRAFT_426538 [Selaginella moellendorffii]|uniref:Uncharacterized protein n=1 Tax=Selaginella moellendorffii TaxID=88036 RepID=D8SWP4_SELML|nr:hypothetical protein SELMODRAFT_426538 [Selaginella moellendorffii]